MAGPKKYVFVNGVMMKNPDYSPGSQKSSSKELGVVSCVNDQVEAKQEYEEQVNVADSKEEEFNFDTTGATTDAIHLMMSPEYTACIPSNSTTKSLFDQLTDVFIVYEVPLGIVSKLLELRHYRLNFLIDDSGSMQLPSDAAKSEASVHMPCFGQGGNMTRLEEEENRLHIFIDILAYIPTKGIQMFFMNTNIEIALNQHGKSPDSFKDEAHSAIRNAFSHLTLKGTPTFALLTKSFKDANEHQSTPTAHFLLTDGCPSDRSAYEVGLLIKNRSHPERNPVSLLSCTNVDSECEWMKEIEEIAPYTSECDDYMDEKREVARDQGITFPYTRGFWLICSLVAAMNPHDLDALDESVPLTKYTLDNVLGRCHSAAEYSYYFQKNPHSKKYASRYERFLTEEVTSVHIVPKNERGNGCCVIM